MKAQPESRRVVLMGRKQFIESGLNKLGKLVRAPVVSYEVSKETSTQLTLRHEQGPVVLDYNDDKSVTFQGKRYVVLDVRGLEAP